MRPTRRLLLPFVAVVTGVGLPAAGQAQCSLTNATQWCAHQDSPGVSGAAEPDDNFGGALAFGDFNGDGYDDLAVGAPGENGDAGFVHVFYSNGARLGLGGQQLFSQDGVGGDADGGAEAGDAFGAALASGDFDGDGSTDLAIGSPGEDLPQPFAGNCSLAECEEAGGIHVVPGGPGGLQPAAGEFLTSSDLNGSGVLHEGSRFGAVLAAYRQGLLHHLVIGAPLLDTPTGFVEVGSVMNAASGPGGLSGFMLTPDHDDCDGDGGERMGSSLAAGRFTTGQGRSFVTGGPTCGVSGTGAAGALFVGVTGGFTVLVQSDFGGAGNGTNDTFGSAVAAGDFDGNGFEDVAAGAPGKNHGAGSPNDSGRVYVAYNDGNGPDPVAGFDIIGEDEWGDSPQAGERFGSALAADDVDGNGFDDLLVGAPGEFNDDTGRVYLKRGGAAGLTTVGNVLFAQSFLGGSNDGDDHFGSVFATGDVDGDGVPEIAFGVPDKDVGTHGDAGMVYVTARFGPRVFQDGFESGNKAAWSASAP